MAARSESTAQTRSTGASMHADAVSFSMPARYHGRPGSQNRELPVGARITLASPPARDHASTEPGERAASEGDVAAGIADDRELPGDHRTDHRRVAQLSMPVAVGDHRGATANDAVVE